jgi:hypothetical protein
MLLSHALPGKRIHLLVQLRELVIPLGSNRLENFQFGLSNAYSQQGRRLLLSDLDVRTYKSADLHTHEHVWID